MNTNEIVVLFKFYIINLAQITYIWYVLYITKHFYLFENFIHIYYIVWSYPSLHSTPAESPSVLISSNFNVFFFLFKTCWTQFNHCCLYCLGLQPSTGALANFVLVKSLSPHLLCYLSLTSLLHKPFRPFLSFISRMFYHLL